MFTGIIEETGTIESMKKAGSSMALTIKCSKILEDVHLGDSIAVNGICLTVTDFTKSQFTVDVMPETVKATSLNDLSKGKESEFGKSDGGKRAIWRPFRFRTC